MNGLVKSALTVGGVAIATSMAAKAFLRHQRWFEWKGKCVLLTGGSRGLGLCLARQLVQAGARVALCARTESDLKKAEAELENLSPYGSNQVFVRVCDVRESDEVDRFVSEAAEKLGRIDVAINNAGIIEVGPLDAMTSDDFHQAMDTHCWGTLHVVNAVLPYMRKQGWGRILNVASLGGKRAVPHMLPYAASKFALVGLSTGLRAELAHENILVTTVCPGLMRTGSPRNAIFKGQHRKEYAWFSIGDSLPLVTLSATQAAEKILTACQRGDAEVVIAGSMNVSSLAARLAPNWSIELLSVMDRILPEMGGIGKQAARGYESKSKWSPSWLTQLTQQAAIRNNELGCR